MCVMVNTAVIVTDCLRSASLSKPLRRCSFFSRCSSNAEIIYFFWRIIAFLLLVGQALVLSVVLVVSVLGASFAGDVHERTEEQEEIAGDQSSSGEGGVDIARSRISFGEPEAEESKENSRREAEEETPSPTTSPPKTAVAKEDGRQETTAQSSDAAAEAGGEAAIASPSAKVIIWDESVDLATIDPNQDQVSAAAAGGGVRERKEPPPSQERHSDVEASKRTGQAGAGGEYLLIFGQLSFLPGRDSAFADEDCHLSSRWLD